MAENILLCDVEEFAVLDEMEEWYLTDVFDMPVISAYFWLFEC